MYYFRGGDARRRRQRAPRRARETVIQFPVADAKTPAEALARAETFIIVRTIR